MVTLSGIECVFFLFLLLAAAVPVLVQRRASASRLWAGSRRVCKAAKERAKQPTQAKAARSPFTCQVVRIIQCIACHR